MADFLKDCQKYFGTQSLYEIFGLEKQATEAEIKSAYRKKSLKVHPDRAAEDKKDSAKKAFQTLVKAHWILSNEESRKLYDESGMIVTDDSADGFGSFTTYEQYEQYWRNLFPKVTTKQIDEFLSNYIGSEEEEEDLKRLYIAHKGDMNMIYEYHFGFDDEDRIRNMIDAMIESERVTPFKAYTNESMAKRKKRAARCAKEAREAEKAAKENESNNDDDDDLIMAIRNNQAKRSEDLLASLEAKYASKNGTKKRKNK